MHEPPLGRSALVAAALAALLACHAALALTGLRRTSVTIDEFSHLPAGLSYWQRGTFALYHHNPPLVKMLAALPVLAARPVIGYDGSWAQAGATGYAPGHVEFGAEFMRANAGRYFELFDRGRCVIVALSVLGGLLVFLWGRDLWGAGGGLLAATLWAFDPNVLAHAGVVTTDVGAAVADLAAVYAYWRWLRAPAWRRAAAAGVVLGLALLVKFSALMLLPLLPAIAAFRWLAAGRSRPGATDPGRAAGRNGSAIPRPRVLAGQLLLVPALGLLVLNAGYGFEGTGRRLGSFPFLSPGLTVPRAGGEDSRHPNALYRLLYATRENRFARTWLGRLPTPLPEHFVLGFDEQRFESNIGLPGGGYAVYLCGEVRRTGWWYYDLVALAVKLPLGTWLLAAAALAAAVLRPGLRLRWEDEAAWALPAAVVLVGMSLLTGLDLGVRYLLPMFPFLFIGCGRLAGRFGDRGSAGGRGERAAILVIGAALVWNFVAAVRTWPSYISYFNEAAGGPSGGHRYLIDSNLDWGQDLLELKRWLNRHPQPEGLALGYFGTVHPGIAGIRYRLPPRDPRVVPAGRRLPGELDGLRPGTYAVSVNFVQGLPHRMMGAGAAPVPVDQDALGYFRALRPIARAGYSIWIYRLDETDVARIRRVWGAGLAPAAAGRDSRGRGRNSIALVHDPAVAVAPAQTPDVGVDDEMVDVDDRDRDQLAVVEAEADEEVRDRQKDEKGVPQGHAGPVERQDVKGAAAPVVRPGHPLPHVEDDHDRHVLDPVEDRGPYEGPERVENEEPDAVGEHRQEADERHRAGGAAPDAREHDEGRHETDHAQSGLERGDPADPGRELLMERLREPVDQHLGQHVEKGDQAGPPQEALVRRAQQAAGTVAVDDRQPVGLGRVVVGRPGEIHGLEGPAQPPRPRDTEGHQDDGDDRQAHRHERQRLPGAGLAVEAHRRCREVGAVAEQHDVRQRLGRGRDAPAPAQRHQRRDGETEPAADEQVVEQGVHEAAAQQGRTQAASGGWFGHRLSRRAGAPPVLVAPGCGVVRRAAAKGRFERQSYLRCGRSCQPEPRGR